MPVMPPEISPEFAEAAHSGPRAILRNPLIRACIGSFAGHLLGVVVLAMTFMAAEGGPQGLSGISAAISEPGEAALEQLDSQTLEAAETSVNFQPQFESAGGIAEPALEFGEVQASDASEMLGDGGLLDSLADEIATAAFSTKGADKPLRKSASFYGIDAEGNDFVFVVDMSGSMSGTRFRRAKSELQRSIAALAPTQRYFIIFFSDDAYPMPAKDLIEANEENLLATRRWLKQAACHGGTHPLPALLDAISFGPDAIFLLSDGKFDPATAPQVDAAEPARPIPIHTIGFASREGEPMLRAISEASGGAYRYVR